MQPLLTFACLSMCVTALMSLLPEQSGLRKTALLCSGLLLAAMWLSSLSAWLPQLQIGSAPDTWLTDAPVEPIAQRQQALTQQMQEDHPHEQATSLAPP